MEEQDKIYQVAIWLTKTLCLDTNATMGKYTLKGLRDKDKNYLGDWEITVKKVTKD